MTVYLASPITQQQWHSAEGMPVLMSYALWNPTAERYWPSASKFLIDSGAFSTINSGKVIDPKAYRDWRAQWNPNFVPSAGLDDIKGDLAKSMSNYKIAGGFPTWHDTDPQTDAALSELIAYARECGEGWFGFGMSPDKRPALGTWLHCATERVKASAPGLHLHGWACRYHWNKPDGVLLDSVDSTNWLLDRAKVMEMLPWVTPAEALDLVVKRYQRERRKVAYRQRRLA